MTVVTANSASNDVSALPLLDVAEGEGDGSSLPLGVIIGTTIGIPAGLAFLAAGISMLSCLTYKYIQHKRRTNARTCDAKQAVEEFL